MKLTLLVIALFYSAGAYANIANPYECDTGKSVEVKAKLKQAVSKRIKSHKLARKTNKVIPYVPCETLLAILDEAPIIPVAVVPKYLQNFDWVSQNGPRAFAGFDNPTRIIEDPVNAYGGRTGWWMRGITKDELRGINTPIVTAPISSVPLPGGFVLLATGLVGLGIVLGRTKVVVNTKVSLLY